MTGSLYALFYFLFSDTLSMSNISHLMHLHNMLTWSPPLQGIRQPCSKFLWGRDTWVGGNQFHSFVQFEKRPLLPFITGKGENRINGDKSLHIVDKSIFRKPRIKEMSWMCNSHMVKKGFLPQMSITKKQREYPGICSQNCQGLVIKDEKSMNA